MLRFFRKSMFDFIRKYVKIFIICGIIYCCFFVLTNFIDSPNGKIASVIDSNNLVKIKWPLNTDTSNEYSYVIVNSQDQIAELKNIIDSATIYDTFSERVLNSKNYNDSPRTATFYYSDGSSKDFIFYRPGSRVVKIQDNKYAYLIYNNTCSIDDYIIKLDLTKYAKNGDIINKDNNFKFEDLFGTDYDKPWCGN